MRFLMLLVEKKINKYFEAKLNNDYNSWDMICAIMLASEYLEKPILQEDLNEVDKNYKKYLMDVNKMQWIIKIEKFIKKYTYLLTDLNLQYDIYKNENKTEFIDYPDDRLGVIEW